MIRVLVADDEPLIRAGIRTVLESAAGIAVVAQAEDGREAVDLAARHRVDVALLDVRMPVLDGLDALAELRRWSPEVRVVMLTSFGAEDNVTRAMRDGVAGFVLKNCTPDELIRAVRAAYAGDAYLSPPVTRLLMDLVSPVDARRQPAADRLAALTPRETELARLIAEGLPNSEIGRRLHVSEATVKTYVSRILDKLDCANRVQIALLVRDAAPDGGGPVSPRR